jgi:hypothetical protein
MRSQIVRGGWFGLGILALILAVQGHVMAGSPLPTPEIDGRSLSAGLGLLAAGALIVRSRIRSK